MDRAEAVKVISALGYGQPPDGYVRQFTVGREEEIRKLANRLHGSKPGATLVKANWGAGKSHLLKFIRETALEQGFAVSLVECDTQGGTRFNRMDQIFGAVCREIEIPDMIGTKGIRPFFDYICGCITSGDSGKFWRDLTNDGKWKYSEVLISPGLYIALRAWAMKDSETQNLVEDWLTQPWKYRVERKLLYGSLIRRFSNHFSDPRPEWKFYDSNASIFDFQIMDYIQSWAAITDLLQLCYKSKLEGLVILFDELEKTIVDLRNIKFQEKAFWNLFQFNLSAKFPGMTFFAVTPDFVNTSKDLLYNKNRFDYDWDMFDKLPTFAMSPLSLSELAQLAEKIIDTHALAYDWNPRRLITAKKIDQFTKEHDSLAIEHRTRQFITDLVDWLNELLG